MERNSIRYNSRYRNLRSYFGYFIEGRISGIRDELENTRYELTELQSRVKKTKRDFAAYFRSRKREFSEHVAAETEKAVQILVGRRLTEAARREIAALQAYGRRPNQQSGGLPVYNPRSAH